MANIQNELNNIKNALFGQEVRGSIHDGIDAINKEVESTTGKQVDLESTFDQLVINAGNSNAEIVDARVKADGTSYSKLGDRLDAVDSQLEHKANEIIVLKDNKINVKEFNNLQDAVSFATLNNIETIEVTSDITINETVEIINKNFICKGNIIYNGSNDRTVIRFKDSQSRNIEVSVINKNKSTWENSSCIGIEFVNGYNNNIVIRNSDGFDRGVVIKGDGTGFSYNTLNLFNLYNNKYSVYLTNINGGWVNENLFLGGKFAYLSNNNINKSRFGIMITSDDGKYVNNNANVFLKPSFELKYNSANMEYATPIVIEHGTNNRFLECRNETNGAIFGITKNESAMNYFSTTVNYHGSGLKCRNEGRWYGLININEKTNKPTLIHSTNFKTDNNGTVFTKCKILRSDNKEYNDIVNVGTIEGDYLKMTTVHALGVDIDTTNNKGFQVNLSTFANGGLCRFIFKLYDINNNVISDTSKLLEYDDLNTSTFSYIDAYGGVLKSNINSYPMKSFAVADDVKKVFVGVVKGNDVEFLKIYNYNIISFELNNTIPFCSSTPN